MKSFLIGTTLGGSSKPFVKCGVWEPALCSDHLGLNPALPCTSCVFLAKLPNFSVLLDLTRGFWEEFGVTGKLGFLEAHFKESRETTNESGPTILASTPCPAHQDPKVGVVPTGELVFLQTPDTEL